MLAISNLYNRFSMSYRHRMLHFFAIALGALYLPSQALASVSVAIDLDPAVEGIQSSATVAPGNSVLAEVVVDTDAAGLSSYAISVQFDSVELDLQAAPAAIEYLPAGFDANLNAGVQSESEDDGSGQGHVLTFEAVALGSGPANSSFVAGVIKLTAAAVTSDALLDITPGFFNIGIDGAFDNSGSPASLLFNGVPVNAQICGDGILQGVEQCDDSNIADLDGCSRTCRLEEDFSLNGIPSGGVVILTINGVVISVITSYGESAAQVAANLSNAINNQAELAALGVVATASGNQLIVAGSIDDSSITDNGLLPPVQVPLPAGFVWLLLGVLALIAHRVRPQ